MTSPEGPKCGGKRHGRDDTCQLPAGWGTDHVGYGKCRKHLGNAPTVAAAAERDRAEDEARKILAGITDFEPVGDPVEALRELAGRASKWTEVLGAIVADLERIRYRTEAAEQLDARIGVYERAIQITGRLLADIARLNLDERAVRVEEAQTAIVGEALRTALAESPLTPEQQKETLARVAQLVVAIAGSQHQPASRGRVRAAGVRPGVRALPGGKGP